MNFLRNPGWVGSLNRTVAATPVTPTDGPGNWVQFGSTFDISNGGADGSTYSTGVPNVAASSDYGLQSRVWVDALDRPGKSIRFPVESEVAGGNHSHYRAWLQADNTHLTNGNMQTEGRVTSMCRIPPQSNYRGNVFTDPQVWWFGGLVYGSSRYLYFGFELNTNTLGLWNTTDASFNIAANTTLALDPGIPLIGWQSIDFRYRIHATTGYVWLKISDLEPLYLENVNTTGTGSKLLYAMGCGSLNGTRTDLTYFGTVTDVAYWSPV